MGYTLRAALDALPRTAAVRVAELEPAVVAWCRGPLAPLTGRALEDPRVEVVVADVDGLDPRCRARRAAALRCDRARPVRGAARHARRGRPPDLGHGRARARRPARSRPAARSGSGARSRRRASRGGSRAWGCRARDAPGRPRRPPPRALPRGARFKFAAGTAESPGVAAPSVLVIDDGELDRVQAVLERMPIDWLRCAEPDSGVAARAPERSDHQLGAARDANAGARGLRAAALGVRLRPGLPAAARAPARPRRALSGVGRSRPARVRAVPAPALEPRPGAALGAADSAALRRAARRVGASAAARACSSSRARAACSSRADRSPPASA